VLLPSRLGLRWRAPTSPPSSSWPPPRRQADRDSYELATGKKKHISYRANEQVLTVRNAKGRHGRGVPRLERRRRLPLPGREPGLPRRNSSRATSFSFEKTPRRGCSRCRSPRPAGSNTNPSYEEHYQREIAGRHAVADAAGWVFPALFRTATPGSR
jgi:alpha-glucosidase